MDSSCLSQSIETLFNLIGTTYGGDGQSTFALPNLSGRVPVHQGNTSGFNTVLAQQFKAATNVTLTTNQIPIHNHPILSEIVAPGGAPERTATPTSHSLHRTIQSRWDSTTRRPDDQRDVFSHGHRQYRWFAAA